MNDNQVSASVSGSIVQAHVIHGDIWVAERADAQGTPRQLPAVGRHFVGRDAELSWLTELAQRPPGHAAAVCVIDGPAGVGKTTLAVWWGHHVGRLFPDGQLYINLRGFDPGGHAVSAAHAAQSLLEALRVPAGRIPSDLDSRTALFRDLVHARRLLLILDNARDSDQVRPLLPGTGHSFVVVTTRKRLHALRVHYGAECLNLTPLQRAESHALFKTYLGADRVAADSAALDRIARQCSDLPLALTIVAAQLSLPTSARPAAVVNRLEDEHTHWDVLSFGATPDTDTRVVISWSYDHLLEPTARVFRLLSLHPGESMSVDAAITLVGLSRKDARAALDQLVAHNLLVDVTADRYQFHDLLHTYALERCQDHDSPQEQRAAAGRMLDHYLHTAFRADRWLNSHRKPITLTPASPAVVAPAVDTYADAIAWFQLEADNIVAMARYAARNAWHTHAWQLPWTMVNYLYLRGRWHESISLHHGALDATRRLADREAEARTLQTLARAHSEIGQHDDALTYYRDALAIHRATGDVNGQANSLNGMSGSYVRLGRYPEALAQATDALRGYTALADPIGQASTLNLLGRIHINLGDHRAAVTSHNQALTLFRQADDTYGQAHTLHAFGDTLARIGRTHHAATCYGRAIRLHETLGNRYYLAVSHQRLATSLQILGHQAAAHAHLHHALAILEDLGHPQADEVRAAINATTG